MTPMRLATLDLLSLIVLECVEQGTPKHDEARSFTCDFAPATGVWHTVLGRDGVAEVEIRIIYTGWDLQAAGEALVDVLLTPFAKAAKIEKLCHRLLIKAATGAITSAAAKEWAYSTRMELDLMEGSCG